MNFHEPYMQRCLQLAQLGAGCVAPNPLVGAVLVHHERIIGEGYHHQYGESHAEVHCINSVADEYKHLIPASTLYVNLEPCVHFGKTPPCADLIIDKKISRVVIGSQDPFENVNGKGIEKLRQAGIEVVNGVLEKECSELNRRFFTFHIQKRPYIILKWAQTSNGFIAAKSDAVQESDTTKTTRESTVGQQKKERLFISNDYTNRLVHQWRSEEASIMVGTNTAMLDNPSLTTRLWKGNNAVRLVLDMHLRLPHSLQLFDETVKTIVFNTLKNEEYKNILLCKLDDHKNILSQICNILYKMNIQSILVEGGARLLQSFIDEKIYDEIRIIKNNLMRIEEGLAAPRFSNMFLKQQFRLMNDEISIFQHH